MILEIVERFDMGRKLAGSQASRWDFLSKGSTWAVLNEAGKLPSLNERLAKEDMAEARIPEQWTKTWWGNRSRGEVLLHEFLMMEVISEGVTSGKVERMVMLVLALFSSGEWELEATESRCLMLWLMVFILLNKWLLKESTSDLHLSPLRCWWLLLVWSSLFRLRHKERGLADEDSNSIRIAE